VRRAVEAGAAAEDVALAMRAAAYVAVFGLLFRVCEGCDPEAPPDAPGPSGRDGADLWR